MHLATDYVLPLQVTQYVLSTRSHAPLPNSRAHRGDLGDPRAECDDSGLHTRGPLPTPDEGRMLPERMPPKRGG